VTSSHAERIKFVERSPSAVAAQDRTAWLALFADFSVIEDPVGSAPHINGLYDKRSQRRGNDAAARFYDTFIADNPIQFHRGRDFVCGNSVMRDLSLQPSGFSEPIPMHLLYQLCEEGGELKILRLAAHWSPREALQSQRRRTDSATGKSGSLSRLLHQQGLTGAVGWLRGLSTVGKIGIARAQEFFNHFNRAEASACEALFGSQSLGVAWPANSPWKDCGEHAGRGIKIKAEKWIAAGSAVSCSITIERGNTSYPAVAVFELNRRSHEIHSLRYYCKNEQAGKLLDS